MSLGGHRSAHKGWQGPGEPRDACCGNPGGAGGADRRCWVTVPGEGRTPLGDGSSKAALGLTAWFSLVCSSEARCPKGGPEGRQRKPLARACQAGPVAFLLRSRGALGFSACFTAQEPMGAARRSEAAVGSCPKDKRSGTRITGGRGVVGRAWLPERLPALGRPCLWGAPSPPLSAPLALCVHTR